MDSNIEDKRDFDGNLLLAEPHFDEEATLLSAQPVVPWDRVESERRLSRRMSFGIAIISSLVLGALAAKLIYRSEAEEQSPAVVSDVARDGVGLAGEAAPTPSLNSQAAGGSTAVIPDAGNADAQSKPWTSVDEGSVKKEAGVRKLVPPPRTEQDAWRAKRFENDQERTRERRKEVRRHQNKPADGLLRIREIFEGPARP